jgi:hypothetical protein
MCPKRGDYHPLLYYDSRSYKSSCSRLQTAQAPSLTSALHHVGQHPRTRWSTAFRIGRLCHVFENSNIRYQDDTASWTPQVCMIHPFPHAWEGRSPTPLPLQ